MSGLYVFDVYQGQQCDSDSSKREFGLCDSVVDQITNDLGRKNHIIIMGIFFLSDTVI